MLLSLSQHLLFATIDFMRTPRLGRICGSTVDLMSRLARQGHFFWARFETWECNDNFRSHALLLSFLSRPSCCDVRDPRSSLSPHPDEFFISAVPYSRPRHYCNNREKGTIFRCLLLVPVCIRYVRMLRINRYAPFHGSFHGFCFTDQHP